MNNLLKDLFEYIQGNIQNFSLFVTIFTLFMNIRTMRKNTTARMITNYHEIVKSYRDIWRMTFTHPELTRILKNEVDLVNNPVTQQEKRFVRFILQHMTSAYYFMKKSQMIPIEQIKYDFNNFLNLPIPRQVWETDKIYYNKDFVKFIDKKKTGLKLNIPCYFQKLCKATTTLRRFVSKKIH